MNGKRIEISPEASRAWKDVLAALGVADDGAGTYDGREVCALMDQCGQDGWIKLLAYAVLLQPMDRHALQEKLYEYVGSPKVQTVERDERGLITKTVVRATGSMFNLDTETLARAVLCLYARSQFGDDIVASSRYLSIVNSYIAADQAHAFIEEMQRANQPVTKLKAPVRR